MTPQLYERLEPRDFPVDPKRCEWAVRPHNRYPVQCSRKVRQVIEGHGYCHTHAKMARQA